MTFSDYLIRYYFKQPESIGAHLGPKPADGGLLVTMPIKQFWLKETLYSKLLSILRKKWQPKVKWINETANEILSIEVFGSTDDYGDKLDKNIEWYYHKDWKAEHLTDKDNERISGLNGMTILTRMCLAERFIPSLRLQLALRNKLICGLTHMMLVKIPVISFQYFLEIDIRFTINSIRKAKHPNVEELVSYLYETLFLQQKIALSLHEYLILINYTDNQKKESDLIMSEIAAIMQADLAFTYLKASVEKTILLLGYIYQITNLDGLKTHKQRISALTTKIPSTIKSLPYYEFMIQFISSENLDELNSYRLGLLHKRGISDLQPHNYFGDHKNTVPLKKIFQVLHEQHAKNTAVLLATLALLTDDLVVRDKPEIDPFELLFYTNPEFQSKVKAWYYESIQKDKQAE